MYLINTKKNDTILNYYYQAILKYERNKKKVNSNGDM